MKCSLVEQVVLALSEIGQEKMNMDAAMRVRALARKLDGPYEDFVQQRRQLQEENRPSEYKDLLETDVKVEIAPADLVSAEDLWRRGPNGERMPIDVSPAAIEQLERLAEEVRRSLPSMDA